MDSNNRFTNNGLMNSQVASFIPNACRRCHHGGCDVKVQDCGCLFHARCMKITGNQTLTSCPVCHSPVHSLYLMPMDFSEIDQARIAAANMAPSSKRGKKRKNATIARLNPSNSLGSNGADDQGGDGSDLRTGRWTAEETAYCDKLISAYELGELPISEGLKLNDFLATMLKSKQSRLTKKMKNAKLSAKTYKPGTWYVSNDEDAKKFSQLEVAFYESIQCDMERAEIRFHMQKEWREYFSSFCVSMGQKLDAGAWLNSAEELDRRASQAKDAARMARRKVMMGYALNQDASNPERGVFIEKSILAEGHRSDEVLSSGHSAMNSITMGSKSSSSSQKKQQVNQKRSIKDFSSPFVGRVIQYIERHQLPFEHVDAWVPSFVSHSEEPSLIDDIENGGNGKSSEQKCRLCFAGYASTDVEIPAVGGRPIQLSSHDKFDLFSFGEYSSKFSFDVGRGLPGRVYSSGICSWEQGVENAPSHQFERCGGASQWGLKTILGVPIPSPNVGRIVMLLYSRRDRTRDPEMVRRVTEELTKLLPTPKWKLVVDIGSAPSKPEGKALDKRIPDMLKLLAAHIPTHHNSSFSPYLPGFTSLRLLLLKRNRTPEDEDLCSTMIDSYSSYLSSGRNSSDTAWMVARDYMLLTQSSTQNSTVVPQNRQSMQQQQHDRQQQIIQESLQQQIVSQVQHVPNQQHQIQQIEEIQKQASQIRRATPAVPVSEAGNSLLNNRDHQQDALSALEHFATHSAPTGQNGIAAFSQLTQQQQQISLKNDSAIHVLTHNSGLPSLSTNENGITGA
mmetsp:Transcript_55786/g.64420  ORF Transcript_55786/g.64420 Transcript_55786/m.64420 type:complete len:791 (+) Transcript_55786:97-2469(+)